jgi:hypothetical protein
MNKPTLLSSLLLIILIGVAAFFYFSGKPSIDELKKSVAPTASLYPQAKSVSDKLNFINDKSAFKLSLFLLTLVETLERLIILQVLLTHLFLA